MKKGKIIFGGGLFIIILYILILVQAYITIYNSNMLMKFGLSITFELINIIIMLSVLTECVLQKTLKFAYAVSGIMVMLLYTVFQNVVNLVSFMEISNNWLILCNIILLFIYSLVSIPLYIMGRR